jgi:hypothetical protein
MYRPAQQIPGFQILSKLGQGAMAVVFKAKQLSLDRIVAIMTNSDSLRDVIAFPKTTQAQSLMDSCPSEIEQTQLDELGIQIKLH